MQLSFWALVRFLHVLSAILWVGGQLALSVVVRPAATETLDPEKRSDLFVAAGRRFGRVATFVLMPVLLATGLALAWHRGVTLGAFTRGGYGTLLASKIVLAVVSFALAALHGVAASRSGSSLSRSLGIAGAVVSVLVVLIATALVP